jgi:DNA modification methylase
VTLLRADARHTPLADGCVQCVVTSPPYWGLRDYGIDRQIGLEQTPDAYVAELVAVFREVRRVLRDDGVLWLNLGDSYNNRSVARKSSHQTGLGFDSTDLQKSWKQLSGEGRTRMSLSEGGLKEKDLVGIPWRVAFALQADGWYLRSDIIWAKPNPMPESVTDRPTKAHEYVFLLTKRERYAYDAKAIAEPSTYPNDDRKARGAIAQKRMPTQMIAGIRPGSATYADRNARTVWAIATQPYSGAHFATMPEALVERCVLTGSKTGSLVFDPFGGSGTTAAVALRLGRRAVCTELNPAYLTLAERRTHVTLGLPLEFNEATA